MDAFGKESPAGTINVSALLLSSRKSPEAVTLGKNIHTDAIHALQKYSPDLVPTTPSIILIHPSDEVGGGEYLGTLGDKHYLEIGYNNKPEIVTPQSRELITSLHIHESVHQKQFETPEIASAFPTLSNRLSQDTIAQLEPNQLRTIVAEYNDWSTFSDLQQALLEGPAIHTEIYILEAKIELAKKAKDMDRVKILQSVLSHRKTLINKKGSYQDGRRIVNSLTTRFGEESLFELMMSIDYKACTDISADSTQYKEILDNPLLLPGIKRLSKVLRAGQFRPR